MALIQCPECGHDVSDRAGACLYCGFPLQENLNAQKRQKERSDYEALCAQEIELYQITLTLSRTMPQASSVSYAAVATGVAWKSDRNGVIISEKSFQKDEADAIAAKLTGYPWKIDVRSAGVGHYDYPGQKPSIDELAVSDVIRCPYCGSDRFTVETKRFSIGKAAIGALLVGTAGALAGFSENSAYRICSNCLRKF